MRFLICRLRGTASTEILRAALGAPGLPLGLDEVDGIAAARQEMAERQHDGLLLWPPLSHGEICDLLAEFDSPAPALPVICFATQTAADGLRRVLAAGAADCLSSEDLSPSALLRAVCGARRQAEIGRQLERAENHLAEQTIYDPLTRLPDRSQFLIALQEALADASAQDPLKIGAAVYGLNAEFMQLWANAAENHPSVKDGSVDLTIFDGRYDALVQQEQFETMITQGYDAIVFVPIDIEAGATAVESASDAGIPVVGSNTQVNSDLLTSYVGSDDVEAGYLEAKAVLDDISRAPGEALNVLLRLLNERRWHARPIPLLTARGTPLL